MKNNPGQITFGQQIESINVNGFVLTETYHEPHLVLSRHDHECANINLTLDGSFRETLGSHPQECRTDSFLVKPPGESHGNKYGESGARCLIIELLPSRLDDIRAVTDLFDSPAHFQGGPGAAIAGQVYREFRQQASGFELIIEGLILEMLGLASRQNIERSLSPSSSPPRWVREARNVIDEYFAEKISLFSIAETVEIHPAHLARVFRKYYGCSIGEYVRRLRIEYAVREILKTDLPLAEIALSAGFSDQSHFTHEFKRQMRMTPAEYKKLKTRNKSTKTLQSFKNRL